MPYDEKLAQKVRNQLKRTRGITEKKMFGGLCFTLRGNMCCGVIRDRLVVRVGSDRHEQALMQPYVRPMDFTGRPLKGFVYVDAAGCRTDESLRKWIKQGVEFVSSLPPK